MTTPMRDDRDMNDAVHSWLHENDEPTPDRNRHIGRVMGRVDETKQRRRFWPWNPFGRRAMHSARGTEGATPVSGRRTAALAPVRVMTAAVLALLVTAALVWVSAQPLDEPQEPAVPVGLPIDPDDEAVFEMMEDRLWIGPDSDLSAALEAYAEDAVHTALWLDGAEQFEGSLGIWGRMSQSELMPSAERERVRIQDHILGAHRYFQYSPSLGGTVCAFWIDDQSITRHDCILPLSSSDLETPMAFRDLPPAALESVDPSAIAAREELSAKLLEAIGRADRELLEQVVSPSIVHHVRSDNQHYALEGLDEYSMWLTGTPGIIANIDLPAPEGELRWASFSTIGQGALCDFWARDGLIVRHDCVLPGPSTIGSEYLDPIDG